MKKAIQYLFLMIVVCALCRCESSTHSEGVAGESLTATLGAIPADEGLDLVTNTDSRENSACFTAATNSASLPGGCGGGGSPSPGSCTAPAGFTKIYSALDLHNMRNNANDNYFLCNDIVLQAPWQPIALFSATLEGNNKTIFNLQIQTPELRDSVGFFQEMSTNAQVRNLKFGSPQITGGEQVGSVVARNYGTIENCQVTATTQAPAQITQDYTGPVVAPSPWPPVDPVVGGLVGVNYGIVRNSEVQSNVFIVSNAERPYYENPASAGGLVGRNENFIESSRSAAQVESWQVAGGLVGLSGNITDGSYEFPEIVDSHSTGEVGGETAGGLIGQNRGFVFYSSASGDIETGDYPGKGGGFVGLNTGQIYESIATGDVGDGHLIGGFVGKNGDEIPLPLQYPGILIPGYIFRSYATGALGGGFYGGYYAGGFVGNQFSGIISHSYATGDIIDGYYAGGFAGRAEFGTILKSYSLGSVNVQYGGGAFYHEGGFLGEPNQWALTGCVFNQDANTHLEVDPDFEHGIPRTAQQLKTLSTFSSLGWSISYQGSTAATNWKIASPDGTDFPHLFWE